MPPWLRAYTNGRSHHRLSWASLQKEALSSGNVKSEMPLRPQKQLLNLGLTSKFQARIYIWEASKYRWYLKP